jgi:hypothetical protein
VQPLRGPPEVQFLGDRDERDEVTQFHSSSPARTNAPASYLSDVSK